MPRHRCIWDPHPNRNNEKLMVLKIKEQTVAEAWRRKSATSCSGLPSRLLVLYKISWSTQCGGSHSQLSCDVYSLWTCLCKQANVLSDDLSYQLTTGSNLSMDSPDPLQYFNFWRMRLYLFSFRGIFLGDHA